MDIRSHPSDPRDCGTGYRHRCRTRCCWGSRAVRGNQGVTVRLAGPVDPCKRVETVDSAGPVEHRAVLAALAGMALRVAVHYLA